MEAEGGAVMEPVDSLYLRLPTQEGKRSEPLSKRIGILPQLGTISRQTQYPTTGAGRNRPFAGSKQAANANSAPKPNNAW
jgi:hypothetical protein